MALTVTQVKNAEIRDKQYRLFDGSGLYLQVMPNGRKYWRYKYRLGKEKIFAIGVFPELSLKEAREELAEARKLVKQGIDPTQQRKTLKSQHLSEQENSFEIIARLLIDAKRNEWSASHLQTVTRRLEKDVFPWLGSTAIRDISATDILEVLHRVVERGAIETAHRILIIFGQVFRYAVATGKLGSDPSRDLKGALSKPIVKHHAAIIEPRRVGELLRMIDGYQGSFITKCALQLAPLVFVRPGELRQAKWEDIDLTKSQWRFKASKTHNDHIVPLATQALHILEELKPLTGHKTYLFPSMRPGERPMSNNTLAAALRTLGIPKEEMSAHGFRAMARTLLDEELHCRIDLIEHQLAHSVRDALGRAYNRTQHLEERRKMMQKWADYLDGLKKG